MVRYETCWIAIDTESKIDGGRVGTDDTRLLSSFTGGLLSDFIDLVFFMASNVLSTVLRRAG